MAPSVVLVTGVSRFPGAPLAAALAAEPGVRQVIGVDTDEPAAATAVGTTEADGASGVPHRGVRFVRADIRTPIITGVLADTGVDTVVHTGVGGVAGALQLLAGAQRTAGLRRLVVASTSAVYGTGPRAPAVCVENDVGPEPLRGGPAGRMREVEGYLRGFARRRRDVAVTVLRLAEIVGPTVETPVAPYFAQPVVPTTLGYDPRIQFLHEDDALEIFRRAALADDRLQWAVNAAGPGVLALSQAIRRAGRVALPLPAPALRGWDVLRRRGGRRAGALPLVPVPRFGGVLDTTRLREEFGYQPRYSTAEAFDDLVSTRLGTGVVGQLGQTARLLLSRGGDS